MSGVWYLVPATLAVVALGLLAERLYREIFFFEGVRLGVRLHTALYDWWAGTYDAGKNKVQRTDARTLAAPLVERFADQLRSAGFERIEIMPWWERFDLVLAAKQAARHDQTSLTSWTVRACFRNALS